MAEANVPDGEEDEDELKSPVDPKSGSITEDVLVEAELKQPPVESFPVAEEEDEVGIEGIDEPL